MSVPVAGCAEPVRRALASQPFVEATPSSVWPMKTGRPIRIGQQGNTARIIHPFKTRGTSGGALSGQQGFRPVLSRFVAALPALCVYRPSRRGDLTGIFRKLTKIGKVASNCPEPNCDLLVQRSAS